MINVLFYLFLTQLIIILLLVLYIYYLFIKFFTLSLIFIKNSVKIRLLSKFLNNDKIWETPTDAPNYKGSGHCNEYTGCENFKEKPEYCKLRNETLTSEIPANKGTCICVLPQGNQDFVDSDLQKFSNHPLIKKIRKEQKIAENLINAKPVPKSDWRKARQRMRDIQTSNRRLSEFFAELKKLGESRDKSIVSDQVYQANKEFEESAKAYEAVYPNPVKTQVYKNLDMSSIQAHRFQHSRSGLEKKYQKAIKDLVDKAEKEGRELTKNEILGKTVAEEELAKLDKQLREMGLKK